MSDSLSPTYWISASGLRALSILVFAFAAIAFGRTIYKNRMRFDAVDFVEYYQWSDELRLGGDPWAPVGSPQYESRPPNVIHRPGCNYTPAFIVAFEPLTTLSPRVDYWLWQSILIFSLLASTVIVIHELSPAKGPEFYLLGLAAMLLFPESHGAQYESQPTFPLMLLIVSVFALDRRDHEASAGLFFAIATVLKLYPGLLGAYFLLRGRWKTIGWSATFFVAIILAINWRYQYEFVKFGIPVLDRSFWLMQDRSISTVGGVAFIVDKLSRGAYVNNMRLWVSIAVAIDLTLAAAAVHLTVRASRYRGFDITCFGLWLLATLLASPLAWAHELPLLMPLIFGIASCAIRGAPIRSASAIALVTGLTAAIAGYFSSPLRSTHLFFFATLAIYFSAYFLISRWITEYEMLRRYSLSLTGKV